MLCIKRDVQPYPCRQCMACRINRQRAWVARMLLESFTHPASIFVTLTYDDEHVPVEDRMCARAYGKQVLVPDHLTRWLKRLRKRRPVRYFACGEYGDETWRPHFHAVLFGLSIEECVKVGRWDVHPDVQETWGQGYTSAAPFEALRAAYAAGYVCKKLTKWQGSEFEGQKLAGRHPEFARMSRRPGLGGDESFIDTLAEQLLMGDPEAQDVPTEFQHRGKVWPIPPYIAERLREALGMEASSMKRPPRKVVVGTGLATPEEAQAARLAERKAIGRYYRRRQRRKLEGSQV